MSFADIAGWGPGILISCPRTEAIRLPNWGCDSCGGGVYEETHPVDWEDRKVLGGVTFDAELRGGAWVIRVHAC